MTTTKLSSYINGGYEVTIYSDGTKTREVIPPVYPESMDIKITNSCSLANHCKWCHENSHSEGKHGDLGKLLTKLAELPAGVELAIGGGNPLAHPKLTWFLARVRELGLIANITINQMHTNQYRDLITHLVESELVYGIGITYSGDSDLDWLHSITNNVVYHVIAGIHNPSDVVNLPKTLVLGYKQKGKGADYFDDDVKFNIRYWRSRIPSLLGNNIISFDNLALDQLSIKRLLKTEKWDEIYMGDDGTFTFYIDAVKEEFALSSTSLERSGYLDTITEMFKSVRESKGEDKK